jgi:hypothetical protein
MRRYWADRIIAVVFIALSCFFIWEAWDFPAGGNTFPFFALGGIAALSAFMMFKSFVDKNPKSREKIQVDWSYENKKPLVIFAMVLLHIWLIFVLGYFTSAVIFFFVSTLAVGVKRYKTVLLSAVVLFPSMYAFFVLFLKAQLPRGLLF